MVDWEKQNKRNRRRGGDWEREVRAELKSRGWIIDKFSSNVELMVQGDEVIGGEFIPAKPHFMGKMGMMLGAGFPDFLCFKVSPQGQPNEIMLVECKLNGSLSKVEKEKMAWLESKGFDCWVAGKDENDSVEFCRPKKTMAMLKLEKEKNE